MTRIDTPQAMAQPFFTIVFEGQLQRFKGNPFATETPFGTPFAIGYGDAFERERTLEEAADALAVALTDMMRVFPPSGRTREQKDAFVEAGKALAVWRDL
ncbi:hypothetical protein [Brevundimonas naejangsanensis]|uniref:hypothetical protein n=1 Tax=Brevundimonas naejangsanensis TaxID=588932 RepID=UPI000462576A|nr:hypothetical protein [Brevundimonas naejangsanensis]